MTTEQKEKGLSAAMDSQPEAAAEARGLIRSRLGDSVSSATLADLLTVVTELVTNAVRHGQVGVVQLRLGFDADGTITGEVENEGRGYPTQQPFGPSSLGGRGLHIVDMISASWSAHVDDSTVVRFELAPA
jgi:signal transduction histidine kinase